MGWVTISYYIDIETAERLSRDDYLRDWERVKPEENTWREGGTYYRIFTYNLKRRKKNKQLGLFEDEVPF